MTASSPLPTPAAPVGGADLLRALELFVDGPALWGRPAGGNKPGVFIVELPAPQALVQIDPSSIRAWLERVPDLRLDGRRPTVNELQARLASFWLPAQTVLYIGSSAKSIGARLNGMYRTTLGDRRPQSAGHWLKTLHDIGHARIWWAETEDAELYEDAALDAFQAAVGALPFAVLSTPSGGRREHGLTAALRDEEEAPATGPRSAATARSAELERARADRLGVRRSALGGSEPDEAAARRAAAKAAPRATKAAPRATAASSRPAPKAAESAGPSAIVTPSSRASRPTAAAVKQAASGPQIAPTYLTEEGLTALQTELEELTAHRRPEVVARIKAARELGDLSENADYEAARKEQSFLEGRIQQLEQMIKYARIIDQTQTGHVVALGSTVVVESVRHGEETFAIVGSAEADAAAGKISFTSPIGRALIGRRAGDRVAIKVPAGTMEYAIVEVR